MVFNSKNRPGKTEYQSIVVVNLSKKIAKTAIKSMEIMEALFARSFTQSIKTKFEK